jgi:hypothetical protein
MKKVKTGAMSLFRRLFPAYRPYAVTILAAGQLIRLTISANSYAHAMMDAEDMADGGELIECVPAE